MARQNRILSILKEGIEPEDKGTARLIKELAGVRERGYLTRAELIKICEWKSKRVKKWIRKNREEDVKKITREAFKTEFEKRKIGLLTRLSGVGIPMASAILMLTHPQKYCVIDVWMWKTLYKYGYVRGNPAGRNFTSKQWYQYLMIIRGFADKFKTTTRAIERTIYFNSGRLLESGKK